MLTYRAVLDVPTTTVAQLATLLAVFRSQRRCWRRLSCFDQALLTIIHLRKGETFAHLAASFRIGVATCHRYITEALTLMHKRQRPLATAMAARQDAYRIIDGTLIPCDRLWTPRGVCPANWSGKHHREGLNVQVITTDKGVPLWYSPPLPGRTHDLTAARTHGLIQATQGGYVIADRAYIGAGAHVLTCYRGPRLTRRQRRINKNRTRLRNPGERAFAILKSWQIFRRFRPSPNRAYLYLAAANILICP